MTDRELAGCPFCGSSDVSVQVGYHMVSDAKVACNYCSGEGPLFGTDDMDGGDHRPEAIAAWNRRTPSSEGDGRVGAGAAIRAGKSPPC